MGRARNRGCVACPNRRHGRRCLARLVLPEGAGCVRTEWTEAYERAGRSPSLRRGDVFGEVARRVQAAEACGLASE